VETVSFDKVFEYDTLKTGITVLVVLHFGGRQIDLEAKIDTGATDCVFERKHAERLGIDVEGGEFIRFNTAAGNFDAYAHEIVLSVLEIETVSRVFFAKEESFTRNVLGRQGFLDRVKFGLIDYEGKLLLSAYGK
jgi:predicted aspartyl protease